MKPCVCRSLLVAATASVVSAGTARLDAQTIPPAPEGVKVHYGVVFRREFGLYNFGFSPPEDDGSAVFTGALSVRGRILARYVGRRHAINRWLGARLLAEVSGLRHDRFYGFGNGTVANRGDSFFRNNRYQFILRPAADLLSTNRKLSLSIGPELKFTTNNQDVEFFEFDLDEGADDDNKNFLRLTDPYGMGTFAQLGVRADVDYRTTIGGNTAVARLITSVQPSLLDVRSPFGGVEALVGMRFHLGASELAVRAGGERIWGSEIPFREATSLGGNRSLRSQHRNRFTGDGAVYFGSELRVPVAAVGPFGKDLRVGVLGLWDAGRVYYRGQTPGGWHNAVGGGIWLSPVNSRRSVSAVVASGDNETRVFFTTRFLFR